MLIVQAILSIAAFFQLWRTQMLPALYLVIIAALLVLFWLLVKRCQEYSAPRQGIPGVLGVPVRLSGTGLCLGGSRA